MGSEPCLSTLAFFGTSVKGSQINSESTFENKRKKNDDSPIKKSTNHRRRVIESESDDDETKTRKKKDDSPIKKSTNHRHRVIESESDDDETETSQVEKNIQLSPLHKKLRHSSPTTSRDCKLDNENNTDESTSSEKSTVGFSSETVPPLRKTARKNMQRKQGSFEEHQVELVKKLKSPAKDDEKPKCTEMNGTEMTKRQRTNSLDRFLFVKTLPKKPLIEKKESSTELNAPNSNSSCKHSSSNGDQCVAEEMPVPSDKAPVTPLTNSVEPCASTEEEREIPNNRVVNDNSSPLKTVSSPPSEQGLKTEKFSSLTVVKMNNEFDPSKAKYNPLDDASWKRGEDVPFSGLCKTFKAIEDVSGRLKIIDILCNFLRSVIILTPEDFLWCVYLCLNKVAPSFEGIELGIGELYICRAIAQVTGRSVDKIKSDIADKGDLGIVAEESKSNQRMMFTPAPLTVKKVFKIVKEVALLGGQASQSKKIDKIKSLLVACKGIEARYLIRFFTGKLRIGLAEQSLLQAIAQACFLTPPEQSYPPEKLNEGKGLSVESLKAKVEEYAAILKTAYCECPSFDLLVPVLLEKGITKLPTYCKLQPGIPLKPMLAHPTKGVSEVFKRFEKSNFTCEFKYDGERAQIHLNEEGHTSIFSRNQENNTSKYPDIISRLKKSIGPNVKSCVLDAEAVAYDVKEKRILPFQKLSTRKKKDADENDIKVQVCVFPFDLLYLNGRNLVTEPLQVRRSLLRDNFIECDGEFTFAKSLDSANTEDIEKFLDESIKGNCEGLMVKSLDVDATYEIAKRSRNWLKLKKDYLEGVGDTIDVVIIGGFSGHGNRTGIYGGFLLACYDPESEEYQSLCKIGTGFTDESLQKHTAFFKEHVIDTPKSYYRFHSSLTPDNWFEPIQVWEIKCADLSVSPVHMAAIGLVDPEKGISLRFPRFLRIREDKSPEDATSAAQIAQLYRSQEQIKNQSAATENLEEYFY